MFKVKIKTLVFLFLTLNMFHIFSSASIVYFERVNVKTFLFKYNLKENDKQVASLVTGVPVTIRYI